MSKQGEVGTGVWVEGAGSRAREVNLQRQLVAAEKRAEDAESC